MRATRLNDHYLRIEIVKVIRFFCAQNLVYHFSASQKMDQFVYRTECFSAEVSAFQIEPN